MKKIVLMSLVFLSSSLLFAETYNEKALIEKSKKQVLNQLKDPDSAKFRNVFAKDKTLVCGEVNAKNSYGGYNGFTFFYSHISAVDGKLETIIRSQNGKYDIGGVLCKQITNEELLEKSRK